MRTPMEMDSHLMHLDARVRAAETRLAAIEAAFGVSTPQPPATPEALEADLDKSPPATPAKARK